MADYNELTPALRAYYESDAERRNSGEKSSWKLEERDCFLEHLQERRLTRLLEVGAGAGDDSVFFQARGLDVTATDLTPAMVAFCRRKGLNAHVMDFLGLDFADGAFDALYALNCLLHVPREKLPEVLANFHRLLQPGGLFYLGIYGGRDEAELRRDSLGERYFVSWSEDALQQAFSRWFEPVHFRRVDFDKPWPDCFQSWILARR